jgi:hypothetical protein
LSAPASQNKTHYDPLRKILPLKAWRQSREILYDPAASRGTAEAFHREESFLHRGGIVIANLLPFSYWLDGNQLPICFDARVGHAGVVYPDSRRLGIDVFVRADLYGHALTRAAAYGLGKINERPLQRQDYLSRRYVPDRENSQTKAATTDLISPGRKTLIQRTQVRL